VIDKVTQSLYLLLRPKSQSLAKDQTLILMAKTWL